MYFRHLFKSNKVLKTHRFIQISQVGKWDKVPQKLDYRIGPWKHKKKLCSLKNYVNPPPCSHQRLLTSVPSCHIGGDGDHLIVDWGGGDVSHVSSIWLRDNSSSSFDPVAMARTLLMSDLDVGVRLEKVKRLNNVGKLKVKAERFFWENISYKLSCHVAIRARASCNKYSENFWQLTFSPAVTDLTVWSGARVGDQTASLRRPHLRPQVSMAGRQGEEYQVAVRRRVSGDHPQTKIQTWAVLFFYLSVKMWKWREHLLMRCDNDMTVHQRISNCRDPVKYSLARKSSADPVLWGPGHVIKMHTFDQIISDEKFLLSWLQGRAPESERESKSPMLRWQHSGKCQGSDAPTCPNVTSSSSVHNWHRPHLTLWRHRYQGPRQARTDRRQECSLRQGRSANPSKECGNCEENPLWRLFPGQKMKNDPISHGTNCAPPYWSK